MRQIPHAYRKILVIQGRNLGDAVIDTSLINSLGASYPGTQLQLFTRPTFKDVFRDNPYITAQHYAHFPMGTAKQLDWRGVHHLMRQIMRLRRERYDLCVNTAGDFRENLIGWLIRPRENVGPIWPQQHRRSKRQLRPGLLKLLNHGVAIPAEVWNVYDIQMELAHALGCCRLEGPRLFGVQRSGCAAAKPIIGIHPLASQPSKLWAWSKWRELISWLVNSGFCVWVFCAAQEREGVRRELCTPANAANVQLQVGSLREFFRALAEVEVLIGLDSFSIHAACALDVPSVVLNGANDIAIWTPPKSEAVSKGEICPFFPCYNKPRCLRTPRQYECMEVIRTQNVLACMQRVLAERRGERLCSMTRPGACSG
jgi:heptosyltransferase-3